MQLVYPYSKIPKEGQKLPDINAAANRLFSKLSNLEMDSLGLSDYGKNYLQLKLRDLKHNLELASYTISWSMAGSNIPYREFHFIEYGAGTGLTCLLAKELGLTVTYNDIYKVSLNDAMRIADALDNTADYYVEGHLDQLTKFLRLNRIDCDAIASTDVIEHVYDIENFFHKLSQLPGEKISVVMNSGANPYHMYIKRKLMKKQIELENVDRKKGFGHKERDTLKAYRSVREEMISEHARKSNAILSKEDLKKIVERTRGLIKEDIFLVVDKYLSTKQLPLSSDHPTNTCDPYTGNWAEHLMNPYDLEDILRQHGYDSAVIAGFYGNSTKPVQKYIGRILDILLYTKIFQKHALKLAPFYTIYGRKESIATTT